MEDDQIHPTVMLGKTVSAVEVLGLNTVILTFSDQSKVRFDAVWCNDRTAELCVSDGATP
jgi:hypothetical protein